MKRLLVGQVVPPSQFERLNQDIQLRLSRWPAVGFSCKRAGDLPSRFSRVRPRRGRFAEQSLLDWGRRSALRRHNPAQDFIGDLQILLELEGRKRIQIPLSADFIRQSVGNGRLHAD